MVKVVCPDCGGISEFRKKELPLYTQFECENCGVLLQVIDDDPIEVEIVDEPAYRDDDEDEDEDDD